MAQKHTPGRFISSNAKGITTKIEFPYVHSEETNATLALVYGRTEEEATANADLFAAAPDMLEALKEAWREIQAAYNLMGINNPERGQKLLLHAAIAKAEGR